MQIPKSIADRIHYHRTTHEPHNPPVRSIDPVLKDCEHCGAVVDRKESISLIETPYRHWRIRCETCQRIYNPVKKTFETISARDLNIEMKRHSKQSDK